MLTLLAAATLSGGCSHAAAPSNVALQLGPAIPAVAPPVSAPIEQNPRLIKIPSIGVNTSITGVGLTPSNELEIEPLNAHPEQVGWFLYGASPGQPGPALLVSHINWGGKPGAFYRLAQMKVGDKIIVARGNGAPMSFTTTKVLTTPKATFDAKSTYADSQDAQLRLITCGGPLDTVHHNYLDNTIVWATLDKQ